MGEDLSMGENGKVFDNKTYYVGGSGELYVKLNYPQLNHEGKYEEHSGCYVVQSDFESRKPNVSVSPVNPTNIPQDVKVIEHNEGNISFFPYKGNVEEGTAVACGKGLTFITGNNGIWFCPNKSNEIVNSTDPNVEVIPDPNAYSFGKDLDEGAQQQ